MQLQVTPILVLSLMPLFFFLIFKVISYRRKNQISLSADKDIQIRVRVRAHGNFIELVPLFCLIILINEILKSDINFLIIFSSIFVIGRYLHAIGLLAGRQKFRFLGMVCSLMPILFSSLFLAYNIII